MENVYHYKDDMKSNSTVALDCGRELNENVLSSGERRLSCPLQDSYLKSCCVDIHNYELLLTTAATAITVFEVTTKQRTAVSHHTCLRHWHWHTSAADNSWNVRQFEYAIKACNRWMTGQDVPDDRSEDGGRGRILRHEAYLQVGEGQHILTRPTPLAARRRRPHGLAPHPPPRVRVHWALVRGRHYLHLLTYLQLRYGRRGYRHTCGRLESTVTTSRNGTP